MTMSPHIRRKLTQVISIVVIICMLGSLLPPPARAMPLPSSPPDYTENLVAVSGTLEQDRLGHLGFPHPEARPGSGNPWVVPHVEGASSLLDFSSPADLAAIQSPVSGQNSRSGHLPGVGTSPATVLPQPTPVVWASFPQLTISGYSSPLPLQNQQVLTQTFLPIIMGGSGVPPSVVGKKAIFGALLPDATLLSTALGFLPAQVQQVQVVIDAEKAAITALEAEAAVIINDESKTPEQKQATIAAIDYNGRLKAILADSQAQLKNQLGDAAYDQLLGWLDAQWQLFKGQRDAIRSTTGQAGLSATAAATDTCQVFDVYATRSTYTDYSADLPDKYVKFANLGWEYAEAYTNTIVYSITVKYNTTILSDVVVTDIVWNHNDNYWNTITDTVHPRRMFTDLPQGMPEAEAAYFDGYNGGLNEFGQQVTNPAGLNVSQQVASLLGIGGAAWVEVTFPWGCIPDEQLTESRLERSWGINDWSKYSAHLVNPVTGNQFMWFRDLYLPAPSLGVDFVRYYNSQDGVDGIFGRGWSSQFDMRVYPQPDGSYKVRYEDGQRGVFRPDGSGGFKGDAGVFDTFALNGSGFILTTTDQTVYSFNQAGRLQSINDLAGNQISLIYSSGNLTKIIDSVGREITLTFDGNGHVTRIEDSAGRVVTYNYGPVTTAPVILGANSTSSQGVTAMAVGASLLSVSDPNGGTTSYGYDPATQALAQATDPDGITFVQNLYDAQGRVREQRNAAGKAGNFEYDVENLRATFTDNLGNKTIYVFDKKFRTVQEIDALGRSISYKYDDQDNLIEKTDKRGYTWKYAYDSQGNMARREDPIDGYSAAYYGTDVTTWEYNDRNKPIKMTNALGEVTRYEYDSQGNLTAVIEANGATTTSAFNSKGQMTSMTDAEGRITTFEYDAHGNRNKIIDPNGGITGINYDNAGRVLSRTDAEGNTIRYEYDGNGNVTKIIDAPGRETRREYNHNNLVTRQIDRRGAIYEFKYDDDLNQIEAKDPLGYVTKYEYDAMGNRTKMTDANGGVTTYEYDSLYHIVKMTDPAGYITRYEYDENGNMTKAIDAMGGETRFVYDALNRRKFVYDALGHQTEFCYDQLDRVVSMFDPRRALTRFEYDQVGNLKRSIDPLGAVTSFGYDLVHNKTSLTDPNNHTTTFTYDNLNRQITQIDPLGHVVQTNYDRVGNPIAVIDANNNTTTFEYNANYWLVKFTNALNKSTIMTYDEEGNRLSSTDENGHTSSVTYDLRGQATVVIDALNQVTHFTFDANGNQLTVTDANGQVTRSEYDARNLLIKEYDALNQATAYEYDGLRRVVKITDANGKVTKYVYDAVSRLTAVTDAKNQEYRYGYDPVGNQTSVTDGNNITTRFEYNFLNQLVKEVNPLTRTWEYHYDLAGNMVIKVDGKWQAIHYDYDAANRLVKTRYPDGKTVEYGYDNNGNQIKMADWNGVFTETYDALNRRTTTADYKGRQLTYNYDDASNLTRLVYPNGQAVNYGYDARNQLYTMTDPAGLVTSYTYNPIGLLTSQERPNNTRTDFTYDAANRLASLSNTGPGGAVVAEFDFNFDNVGNRTRMVETRTGAAVATYDYGYDDIYQLVSVTSDNGQNVAYTYDPAGNRLELQGTPEPTPAVTSTTSISLTYEYDDLNSLMQAGQATFTYDDNGNRVQTVRPLSETKYSTAGLTGTLITNYTFDVENRMVAVREAISYETTISGSLAYTTAVLMEADYSYDGMGRRVAKLVQNYNLSGAVTQVLLREYAYDGLDVAAEYEYVNGAVSPDVTSYYYGNGAKVTMERLPAGAAPEKYWYTYDALGTTTALLDEAGLIVAEYHHDEYGRLIIGDSLLNRYLFTGQEYDPETGLLHFFARYYDSETGTWLTQDIQRGESMQPATWHRYMYVLNNPINAVDPLGYFGLKLPSWDDVKKGASDAWNSTTKAVSDAVKWTDNNIVKPAVEAVKDAGEVVNNKVIQPVVNTVSETKEWVNNNVVQPVKQKTEQFVNYVNENYVQPAIETVKDTVQSTREALTKAADWIQENRMAVMATVGFVVGLGAGIIAGAAFCALTAGAGCAILAAVGVGLLAGMVVGGAATFRTQIFANQWDSNPNTKWNTNLISSTLIGMGTGAVGGAIGGGVSAVAYNALTGAPQTLLGRSPSSNPLLKPGPNSQGSIQATGPKVTPQQSSQIQQLGNKYGCHTCRSKIPRGNGSWIGDHQPVTKLIENGLAKGPQRLYPQCWSCSWQQGGIVSRIIQGLSGK